MASVFSAWPASLARTIATLVANDGSRTHTWRQELASGSRPLRDLADAVHGLCMVHGAHPGVLDHAGPAALGPAVAWLAESLGAFNTERAYLARLTAAVGPVPSTPGQAESEVAILAQHHAFDMLARSERQGCAIGTAVALVLEWHAVRPVLDTAATRAGVDTAPLTLPTAQATLAMIDALAGAPGPDRAMTFGVQQALAQHRGLWDLLHARAEARDAG